MIDTFTLNQLIRYVYQDCSQDERQILEEIAISDRSVFEEICDLRMAKNYLPKVLFGAHPRTLSKILDYSRKTA